VRPRHALLGAAAAAAVVTARRALRGRRWELAGRVVLVTGGSRGLGLAIARELLRQGAKIAVCGRDRDTLDRAWAELARDGGTVLPVRCDVTSAEAVGRMVNEVTAGLGPIDAVINNAGTIAVGPVQAMDLEDFRNAMDVNFWGALHTILAVLPGMRRRGAGRIVNVASIGGKISVPHLVPYSASKFALVGLSEGLRAELRGDGIEVTTICPGLMRTGSPRHAWFTGRHRAEYAWFSVGDSLPGLSMDADRAARQIVEALRSGQAERVLSLPARVGAKAHALFPGLSAELLALVDRWLPQAPPSVPAAPVEGWRSTSAWSPSWLTRLGDRAAERHNQTAPPASPRVRSLPDRSR
jgi:NAD(P)-dependent dehydrogenase (short-subunit alcohol dehydrogenase family)